MSVYRVNKTSHFTVVANYHLQDTRLSLKAVGLLTKMLSFPDGWKFSTEGFSAICKEAPDAIQSTLKELEQHGYLARHRQRDEKGRMACTVFEIYEKPQSGSPHVGNPKHSGVSFDRSLQCAHNDGQLLLGNCKPGFEAVGERMNRQKYPGGIPP